MESYGSNVSFTLYQHSTFIIAFYFANTKRLTFDTYVISRDEFQKLRRGNIRGCRCYRICIYSFSFPTTLENIRSPLIFVFRITERKDRSRIRSFVKINFKKRIFVKDLRKDTSTIEFVSIMYVTI